MRLISLRKELNGIPRLVLRRLCCIFRTCALRSYPPAAGSAPSAKKSHIKPARAAGHPVALCSFFVHRPVCTTSLRRGHRRGLLRISHGRPATRSGPQRRELVGGTLGRQYRGHKLNNRYSLPSVWWRCVRDDVLFLGPRTLRQFLFLSRLCGAI